MSAGSKKAKKKAKAQTRSNSLPRRLRMGDGGDKEDAKPRKGKRLSILGQTMTELTSDLNPREFLKDFNIGSKKPNGTTTQKVLMSSGDEVPESPSARKPRPSLAGLASWTTKSSRKGIAVAKPEESQPTQTQKGKATNTESNSKESPPVSPVNKKAGLKKAAKSPKKKKSVVKKGALSESKTDNTTGPVLPQKKRSIMQKAFGLGQASAPPKSPKKKKGVLEPTPIGEDKLIDIPTDSKKASKKKNTKTKGGTKEKAGASDKEVSSNSLSKGKKKKDNSKKKVQENQDGAVDVTKAEKSTKTKKKTKATKKAKKGSEDS